MNQYVISSEHPHDLPVLVIDQVGIIGRLLSEKLSQEFLTIFVHGPTHASGNNIIQLPYRHKMPNISDNLFSYIFVISEEESEILGHVKRLYPISQISKSPFIVVIPSQIASEQFLRKLKKYAATCSVMIYGDIFGANADMSIADTYMQDAYENRHVTISITGTEKSYPIFLGDVAAGIIRGVFAKEHTGELFLLMPDFFVTDISFVRMMQQELPELQVFTHKKMRPADRYFLPPGIPVYAPYDIEQAVKAAIAYWPQRVAPVRKRSATPSRLTRFKQFSKRITVLACILLISILGIGLLGYLSVSSVNHVKQESLLRRPVSLQLASVSLLLAEQATANMAAVLGFFGANRFVTPLSSQIASSQRLVELELLILAVQTEYQGYLQNTNASPDALYRLTAKVKRLYKLYKIAEAEKRIMPGLKNQYSTEITFLEKNMSFLDILPALMGEPEKKKYLVLLTNNRQLRGGGGAIEVHAYMTVEKGRVKEFEIKDAGALDDKETEEIAVPSVLATQLGRKKLVLRESTAAVDFQEAMKQVALVHYLSTNIQIDGIISLDATFLTEVLRITGPVQLPDKTILSADSLPQVLAKQFTQKNPTVSQEKTAFFTQFHSALVKKLKSEKDLVKLLTLVTRLTAERHLLLYSEESQINQLLLISDFAPTLQEKRVRSEGVYNDVTSLVETHVSEENASHAKQINHKVRLSDTGDIEEVLAVTYSGAAVDESFYSELVIPEKAEIQGITIDGVEQRLLAPGARVPVARRGVISLANLTLEKRVVGERQVIGFVMRLPKGATKNVEISYRVIKARNTGKDFIYEYLFLKQPGSTDGLLNVAIDYPPSLEIATMTASAKEMDKQILYSGSLKTDQNFQVVFSSK